jgi:CxxC motif-containing protein (DUF1111 family)
VEGTGGDGLGPLYNETSCVACHNLHGSGGAGRNDRNVVLLTVGGQPGTERGADVFQGELEDLHPGLRGGSTVVLHRHATSEAEEDRLSKIRRYKTIQTRDGLFSLQKAERSSPALFGAGLIDGISDKAILAARDRRYAEFPEIKGRISQLKDGRIGRFGWKGHVATLREFVLGACANEVGLEVPGHHQPSLASAREFNPERLKLDMDEADSEKLFEFVRWLPRPVFRTSPEVDRLRYGPDGIAPERGLTVFKSIGCATCHTPKLGEVEGLYSDLLLHDLGDKLLSAGSSYGGSPLARVIESAGAADQPRPTSGDGGPTEWRTPPLWGVAGSAPYLHDGRAGTLHTAIQLHGGEAEEIAARYTKLDNVNQQSLLAFLHSLSPPSSTDNASRKDGPRLRVVKPSPPSPSPGGLGCFTCFF